jgi:hypothetical protein
MTSTIWLDDWQAYYVILRVGNKELEWSALVYFAWLQTVHFLGRLNDASHQVQGYLTSHSNLNFRSFDTYNSLNIFWAIWRPLLARILILSPSTQDLWILPKTKHDYSLQFRPRPLSSRPRFILAVTYSNCWYGTCLSSSPVCHILTLTYLTLTGSTFALP